VRGRECDVAVVESGVRQSMAKGEPRYRCVEDITAAKVEVSISTDVARIGGSSTVQEIVVGG
jgi:hypothetical protein